MRPDHGNSRRRRTGRADYGFDGSPAGAVTMAAAGIALVGLARLSRQRRQWCATAACGLGGAATLAVVALYVHATRRGKFTAWTEILD
ncbi:MAG TPA: hypothetical protein VEH82_07505, partial [Acidimicrobiales bacterium]|nr:hypothetical protein [Acidimicrobiales bacterium]